MRPPVKSGLIVGIPAFVLGAGVTYYGFTLSRLLRSEGFYSSGSRFLSGLFYIYCLFLPGPVYGILAGTASAILTSAGQAPSGSSKGARDGALSGLIAGVLLSVPGLIAGVLEAGRSYGWFRLSLLDFLDFLEVRLPLLTIASAAIAGAIAGAIASGLKRGVTSR